MVGTVAGTGRAAEQDDRHPLDHANGRLYRLVSDRSRSCVIARSPSTDAGSHQYGGPAQNTVQGG